jgi:hypothetical protein
MYWDRVIKTMEETEKRVLALARAKVHRGVNAMNARRAKAQVRTRKEAAGMESSRGLIIIAVSVVAVGVWYLALTSLYLISLPVHFITSHH